MIRENGCTLRDFYTGVYAPLRLRGKSASTKKQYLIQLRHFGRFLGREATFDDLTDETVSAFLASIVERGNSPETANKARNHILALWRLAARKNHVATYPDVAPEQAPRRTPRAWLSDDLARLFSALGLEQGVYAGIPRSLWWHALHEVLWWTGERIGAVLQLRWEHLDQTHGWLMIPAEIRKRKTADRIFELPAEAIESLKRIHYPVRDLIFPWPKDRSLLWQDYKRILKAAGLPFDRKSMFHRMRRSSASHFEAAGGNATELLGHSSREVTLSYLDPRIVKPDQPANRLFSPGGKAPD